METQKNTILDHYQSIRKNFKDGGGCQGVPPATPTMDNLLFITSTCMNVASDFKQNTTFVPSVNHECGALHLHCDFIHLREGERRKQSQEQWNTSLVS